VPAALGDDTSLAEGVSSSAAAKRKPIPAFYHAYLHSRMKRIGVIKATDAVYHHIEMAGEHVETMHPRHQPMVAKPLPWTSAEQVSAQR
jgi:DNA-directed RNA polymerase